MFLGQALPFLPPAEGGGRANPRPPAAFKRGRGERGRRPLRGEAGTGPGPGLGSLTAPGAARGGRGLGVVAGPEGGP